MRPAGLAHAERLNKAAADLVPPLYSVSIGANSPIWVATMRAQASGLFRGNPLTWPKQGCHCRKNRALTVCLGEWVIHFDLARCEQTGYKSRSEMALRLHQKQLCAITSRGGTMRYLITMTVDVEEVTVRKPGRPRKTVPDPEMTISLPPPAPSVQQVAYPPP